jgi:hypothetical protein
VGPLGNGSPGRIISNTASNNTIGGAGAAANTIAFNQDDGVTGTGGMSNQLNLNSFHSNTGLGIDLAPNNITPKRCRRR